MLLQPLSRITLHLGSSILKIGIKSQDRILWVGFGCLDIGSWCYLEQLRYAACLPGDDKKLIDPCISEMAAGVPGRYPTDLQ